MKKLFYAATGYLVLGLAAGMFYREFTHARGFTAADGFTQLSVVHTHVLTLGVILLLVVLVLERVFALSRSALFGWFFWVYNLGLLVSVGAMTTNGVLTVLGADTGKALAGIAGSGHIIMTAGLVLLFVALGRGVNAASAATAEVTAAEVTAAAERQ